jgi:hypothetical protein
VDQGLRELVLDFDGAVAVVPDRCERLPDTLEVECPVAEVGERPEVVDDVVEVWIGRRERVAIVRELLDRVDVFQVDVGDVVGEAFDPIGDVSLGKVITVWVPVRCVEQQLEAVDRVEEGTDLLALLDVGPPWWCKIGVAPASRAASLTVRSQDSTVLSSLRWR